MRKILTIILMLSLSAAYAGNYAYQQSGKVSFGWQSSDVFTVFSAANTILKVTTKEVSGSDEHYSATEVIGWAFTPNATYYSFYPYSSEHKKYQTPYTSIPVQYTSQTQVSNANTGHLASFDYMAAHTKSTDDALSFSYTHLGSILRIAAYVPESKTFTSLALIARDNTQWFTAEATMNATNNTLTPTANAATATLSLNNIAVEAGDSLIAYMMLPPTDLSGKSMMLSLNATDGSALQTYIAGVNIQAGKVYPVSIGRENYFKVSAVRTADDDNQEEVLSLPADLEEKRTTAQITTATAYAPDFTPDTENEMKPFLLGDVNFDGKVNVTDAVKVTSHYLNDTTDELDFNVSDINGDNKINVTDVIGITNIYLHTE